MTGRTAVVSVLSGLATLALGTVLATFLLLATTYRVFTIPSGAMEPTLPIGSGIVVERGHAAHDGDIVVFPTWSDEGPGIPVKCCYVKRVIATGGEVVACCTDGAVMRNGVRLSEPYLLPERGEDPFASVTVPAGRMWLLGDNRANSADSRYHVSDAHHGTVAASSLIGRVVERGNHIGAYGYVLRKALLYTAPMAVLAMLVVAMTRRRREQRRRTLDAP